MPPLTERSIDPSDPPLQLTFICVDEREMDVGSEIVTDSVSVHPLASVTVTEYVPADSELKSSVIEFEGSFQLKL